jgi:1-acyl-sn-glycerol-3-phosphate acyltransferase
MSIAFLKLTGWKVEGHLPDNATKCVLIAAPHTSNWDLPYTLMVAFVLRLNVYWMGKSSIFKPPFRGLMMWLGGIAVNREQSTNLVAASAQAMLAADGMVQLIVPPEGTRSKTRYWKTGFYYIALQAQVPIVMAYLDYAEKRGGLGPALQPSGDIEKDMALVKAFYAPIQGKHADRFEAE